MILLVIKFIEKSLDPKILITAKIFRFSLIGDGKKFLTRLKVNSFLCLFPGFYPKMLEYQSLVQTVDSKII